MKHIQFNVAAGAATALAAAALVAGCANPERSRDLANPAVAPVVIAQQVCSACHGVAGVSTSPNFPNLAAQTPTYLVAQLKGFRSHDRSDPAGFEYMWGLSRSLTDAQIAGLADYYAHMPPATVAAAKAADSERISAGDKLFHEGIPARSIPACTACHGDHAQGNDTFPRLAGQHADYVAKQLMVFQRGDQRPEGPMKGIAHQLTPQDIKNVAAYVASLSR